MFRSNRRIREEEDGTKDAFDYRPGDRTVEETAEGLNVRFKLRILADLLKCPVCRGFFRNAYTIRECLHTFCRSCIFGHVLQGGGSCPTCSQPLPSNVDDAIGSDSSIQNLVDKLFPHFAEEEANEKKGLYEFCGISDAPAAEKSHEICCEQNAKSTSQADRHRCAGGWDATHEFFEQASKGQFNVDLNLSFALFPATAKTPGLQRPYFRCSAKMPLSSLAQYLTKKLNVEYPFRVDIFLGGLLAPNTHTLEFIFRSRKLDTSRCLLLQYEIVNYLGGSGDNDNYDNSATVPKRTSCYNDNGNGFVATGCNDSTHNACCSTNATAEKERKGRCDYDKISSRRSSTTDKESKSDEGNSCCASKERKRKNERESDDENRRSCSIAKKSNVSNDTVGCNSEGAPGHISNSDANSSTENKTQFYTNFMNVAGSDKRQCTNNQTAASINYSNITGGLAAE